MQLMHLKATRTSNLIIVIAGLTVSITKKNLIAPYKEMYKGDWDKDFNKTEGTLTYGNGSIVYFMSTGEHNAGDKFTGIKANYVLLDEINLSPEGKEVVKQLGMRLERGSIILTMNPTRRLEWIENVKNNPRTTYIHSTYKDNLDNLPVDLVDDIEYQGTVDERFNKVYLQGIYMASLEGAVYTNWDIVNTMPKGYKWESWGQDYGFKADPTTLVQCQFFNNELWIRGRGYAQGLSTDEIAEMNKYAGRALILGDNSEPRLINELSSRGNNITGIKKYPGHKLEAVRKLKNIKIHVYYDDPNLIREIEDYSWKKKAGEYVDEMEDKNDHYMDAVAYAVRDKLTTGSGNYNYR